MINRVVVAGLWLTLETLWGRRGATNLETMTGG